MPVAEGDGSTEGTISLGCSCPRRPALGLARPTCRQSPPSSHTKLMTDPHPAHAESTTAPVSSTAALAALAGSFLARPLGPFHQRPLTPGPDDAANHDDDDDDEPVRGGSQKIPYYE